MSHLDQSPPVLHPGDKSTARRYRWHLSGILLCIVIGAMAGAMLFLFFHAPRSAQPVPTQAVIGVPDKPIRIASYNILHNRRGRDAVILQIQSTKPDFVFLQELDADDLREMSKALGMEHQFYYPSENLDGATASWGNAILSKHPLYDARSIPNPGGGSFGVWAWSVIDNKKFMVGCVHLSATWNANPKHIAESSNNRYKEITNLRRAWEALNKPPIVFGGDFNQLPIGNNYSEMTADWIDGLKSLNRDDNTFVDGVLRTRIDYLLASNEWEVTDGGVVLSDASDHRPIWIEAKAKQSPTTAP
jgi:endonuclease/exonuclease/phosphatase family metal-dependent hydrolase